MNSVEEYLDAIHREAEEKLIPLSATIELTYHCNLKCIHCYRVEDMTREELTTDEVKKLLDQLRDEGTLFLTFTGGEIFTREDIFEILFHAKENQFAMYLFTNGTLLTPEKAEKIAEVSPLRVEFSLYGANPETYEDITQIPGSFKNIIKGIQLLKKNGVKVYLKTPLMKVNFPGYKDLIKMVKDMGMEMAFDPQITPKNDGSIEPLNLRLNEETLLSYFEDDYPEKWKYKEYPSQEESLNRELCAACKKTCAISPYGDVYPCFQLILPIGNIRENSFSNIWHSNSELLNRIRSLNIYSDIPECRTCEEIPYCRRCHGLAYVGSKDWTRCDQLSRRMANIIRIVNTRAKHPHLTPLPLRERLGEG